jgi:hypothetical protein
MFGLLAAAISFHGSGQFNPAIYEARSFNLWFDADQPRILLAITEFDTREHVRTGRHPLFVLFLSPMMRSLPALGVEPLNGMRWIISGCALLAAAFLFLALRGLGLPRPVAALFASVFLASATFLHWLLILETYPFAAASISFMLMILTSAGESRWWPWIVASVALLSITITNWTLALASTLFRFDLTRAIIISAATLVIVASLALAQKFYYPRTTVFFSQGSLTTQARLFLRSSKRTLTNTQTQEKLWSVIITSAVAPAPELILKGGPKKLRQDVIINQYSPFTSYTTIGWVGVVAWLVLLAAGTLGGWANVERRRVFAAISVFLLGQIALHAFFGPLTFLFAANFFGAFVLFTAFGWFSPLRVPAVIAAIAFVVFGGISNYLQFQSAMQLANSILNNPGAIMNYP